ncbi:DUF5615 family PIN-like protein [Microcoleus sp. herbarium12]|uniref:DUF5615 family PIN-like protein n=1 Tax=Microcoleus sp. herbarium12 TaxID=3055437 RepID=UPI002FD055F4
MSRICLYMDEDILQRSLILALRTSGIDVITTSDANNLSCSDEEQLIWAAEQGRAIYSFNTKDFCRLHSTFVAQEIGHAGIIMGVQQRYSIGEQLRGILNLIATKSAEDMINQLVFLAEYIKSE